jgi:hypothetical protein
MDADFPAAHSMDTEWFAIDQNGFVGLFFTGEDGHIPSGAYFDMAGDGESLPPLPAEMQGAVFIYEFADQEAFCPEIVPPYERTRVPKQPLHIDQLPPRLREAYGRFRFDSIHFAEAEWIQPWEYAECDSWDGAGAYLSADRKSVRPIPGTEEEFHDLCLEAKQYLPPELKNIRFEEPPKKPRRRKKKGDADER